VSRIRVVTIARHSGTGATEISKRVAESLGFDLLDDHLREAVVARNPEAALAGLHWDERLAQPWLRALGSAALSMSGVHAERRVRILGSALEPVTHLQDVIREAADRGQVVLIGRGAAHLLAGRPECLHVLITAPEPVRAANIAAAAGVSMQKGLQRIRSADRAQADFVRTVYGLRFDDHRHYDLVVASGPGREQAVASAIAAYAREL
jgi:cytidylate kinase